MPEPPGVKHKGLMNKEAATVIITAKVEEIIATMPQGGSSGILECGDFNTDNEGILKIDLGGF